MFISGCVQKVCPPQLLKPMTFFFNDFEDNACKSHLCGVAKLLI